MRVDPYCPRISIYGLDEQSGEILFFYQALVSAKLIDRSFRNYPLSSKYPFDSFFPKNPLLVSSFQRNTKLFDMKHSFI